MASLSAATKDENVVTIKNLNFRYDTGAPLNINGLDCVIPANAKVILVGANGAGKSTLLRVAAGEWPLLAGEVARNCDVRPFFLTQDANDYFMSSPHTLTSPRIYPYLPTSRHTSP